MAFIPGSVSNKYIQNTKTSPPKEGGFVPGSVAKKVIEQTKKTSTTGFVPGSVANKYATTTQKTNNSPTGSSQKLYQLAVQNGLQRDADRVLQSQSGEDTKKIFSGGFISDIFDVLNSFQYGVVGTLKGKGFLEGVKTRQSWSDKDALGDNGIPGVIAGIALDIASDPLTYIAPWTIAKKIPGLAKGAKAIKEITEASKAGKWFGNKFVYMFGADPVFKRMYEKSVSSIATGVQNITEMTRGVAKITPDIAKQILSKDETGRFIRTPLEKLKDVLNPEQLENVKNFYTKLDDLGKQAVDTGLLSKGKYEDNLGEYIKNAYTEFELSKKKSIFSTMKKSIKGIKARVKGLTPEKMKELGQIDNPAYLLFKSTFDLTKDVENAKLFQQVARQFGKDTLEEGFKQLPKGQRLGELAGKFVPENIYNYIQEIAEPFNATLGKKIVAGFKFGKVVLSPATHARNVMSNEILNWWKLGMNPLDPRTIKANTTALKEISKKGGKWIDEAKTVGYGLDTFASNEIKALLNNPEAMYSTKKLGNAGKNIADKFSSLYQGEENYAKLSAFIFNRNKGLGIEDAWKAAESATFNYAQVTPFIRKLRESLFGFPFITFSLKSAPVVAETALKAPKRISVFGKIKTAIENASDIKETERERASEPAYIQDGFYIKLPIKDKNGNSAYFDLTYIIPFGDLMSGNLFERQTNRDTGLPESIPSAILSKSPAFNLVKELSKNQDFYGDKIWKDSDNSEKQLGDLMRHLTKTYLPPLVADQIPGGYKSDGTKRKKGIVGALTPEQENEQKRTLMEEMLRNIGAKVQPIDVDIQETYQEWNKKKALESLLREKGIMREFSTSYIPK